MNGPQLTNSLTCSIAPLAQPAKQRTTEIVVGAGVLTALLVVVMRPKGYENRAGYRPLPSSGGKAARQVQM